VAKRRDDIRILRASVVGGKEEGGWRDEEDDDDDLMPRLGWTPRKCSALWDYQCEH
jgi:hypothetical protein